jgi:predicted small lipoprotein YifL
MTTPRAFGSAARAISAIAAVFGLAISAGCGQKGPLFLPESRPPVVEEPAAPAATAPAAATPDAATPDEVAPSAAAPAAASGDEEEQKPR